MGVLILTTTTSNNRCGCIVWSVFGRRVLDFILIRLRVSSRRRGGKRSRHLGTVSRVENRENRKVIDLGIMKCKI